ncbi:ChbG/HpnK family deacetylase [Candidimonas nitroreducens]|uniref:ChbG/HpnK family deacetylase n=1 Tax=Candidimonas nitroreducens TaxID=683354 RepID=UPI0018E94D56|nr:ChbG/HpnK family deacetylase [Candidimonas nitroreducens]
MNPGVNEAVLRLADLGRLSATSCMSGAPHFRADAAALAASGLQTGLHLNFTEALGDAHGLYLPLSRLIALAYLRRLDQAVLRAQVARQLDDFEDAMGRAPDFVDGHQHVHQLPQLRSVLLAELERRYAPGRSKTGRSYAGRSYAESPDIENPYTGRPWLRYTAMRRGGAGPLALVFKAGVIELLGAHRFARMARRLGYRLNPGFLGVYGFQGGEPAYRTLLRHWLKHAHDADLLMCHPAARACEGDGLGAQRTAEFRVLASDEMPGWLAAAGLELR